MINTVGELREALKNVSDDAILMLNGEFDRDSRDAWLMFSVKNAELEFHEDTHSSTLWLNAEEY